MRAPRCSARSLFGAILVIAGAQLGSGCKSAEERCKAAVDPARSAWDAYRAELDAVQTAAKAQAVDAAQKLEALEEKLDQDARKKADALNRPGDSAWYRTYNAARQALCSDDETCSALKGQVSQAELTTTEMEGRLAKVDALLKGLDTPHVPLPEVEDDFDRRSALAAARETVPAVAESCPPPAE